MDNDHQDGNVTGNVAQTEQALRASELSYRRLFEAAKDGILILDVDTGRITDVNPFLFHLLGFSHDEMMGKTVGELSPFKDTEWNKAMFERLQKDGYVRYENLPLETRDGRNIAVEFVSNVYQAGDKKVIQCNIRDITERKAAEKELSRLAAIIECSADAIVSKTPNGIVIGWNRGAERLYGYTAEEMLGQSITRLYPPDHYPEYLRIMKEVKAGKAVPAYDTVRQRKDGTIINVSVGFTPIEARDCEVVGMLTNSHDITRIKNLEAQFIEAQKMEAVGQLAGGLAHDFNNILSVIIGYSDLMIIQLGPDGPGRTYVEEIRLAAARATALTQQLLIFSRKQMVQPIVLDLNETVKELDKMLRRLVDENIEMTIILGNYTGRIKADPGYIGQVLMNLVINARDAMPDGGKLTITTSNAVLDENYALTHAGVTPGQYVLLSVCDTGTGMTDEVKAHLFEAFFTTKPKGKGTGLGLATCQTIIQLSGGHIAVFSEVGKGTTFEVYFPRIEQPVLQPARPSETSSPQCGTETLLLVEDDPSVRNLARHLLEGRGYKVLLASNGQDALKVISEHRGPPISLVITDVIMPLMGGKVMAEWLKATYPELKILFTSGYMDDVVTKQGVLDSGIAFLPKPYNALTLTHTVRAMIDNKTDTGIFKKEDVTTK